MLLASGASIFALAMTATLELMIFGGGLDA
jgi:hypothetical protein